MKSTLIASILLNAVLIVLILSSADRRRTVGEHADSSSSSSVGPVGHADIPSKQTGSRFPSWNEIESPDYRVYIGNLRRIGCPERTIRDIIVADVAEVYAARRKADSLGDAATGPWSRQEEIQFIASLLGVGPGTESRLAASASPAKGLPGKSYNSSWSSEGNVVPGDVPPGIGPARGLVTGTAPSGSDDLQVAATAGVSPRFHPAPPPQLPLVLHDMDPSSLRLNETQTKAIETLREEFIAAVGGPGQNPADPDYARRWQKAQPLVDEELRGVLGIAAWQSLQIEAYWKLHGE